MELATGQTLTCPICEGSVVILSLPLQIGTLACDGSPMLPGRPRPCSARREVPTRRPLAHRVGQKYGDAESGLQVLCTYSGSGRLTFNGRLLAKAGGARDLHSTSGGENGIFAPALG